MGSIGRKIKRKKEKRSKKDLKEKLGMFDRLGDECEVCAKPFDKKSKEEVQNWFVIVKNEQETVRLYCPECWNRAQETIKQIKGEFNDHRNRKSS